MALDEYSIDPPQPGGPKFAADRDATGKLWPFGKVAYGVEGSMVTVSPLTPLPVTITAGNPETGEALGKFIAEWTSEASSPAERLLAADDERLSIIVQNFGALNVWLGGSSAVAEFNGTRLLPGQGVIIDRAPRAELWGYAVGPCVVGGIVEKYEVPAP